MSFAPKPFFYHYLAILIVMVFAACENPEETCSDATNPECPNYDTCLTAEKTDAHFVIVDSIRPSLGLNAAGFATDTIWPYANIYFRATHPGQSYAWRIGSDPQTFTEKEFTLFFPTDLTGPVPIELITTKQPLPACFPGDDGRDTFQRTLYLIDLFAVFDQMPILGTYKGFDTDKPNETFTITIEVAGDHPADGIHLIDFPKGCDLTGFEPRSIIASWKGFYLESGQGTVCGDPEGIGTLSPDGKTLTIRYTTVADPSTLARVSKTFVGERQ